MKKNQAQLGTEKIPRLLLKQSMPATIGLLVMSLYNVADTIFIGHGVGTLAIAGLAIAFPLQMVVMAIAQAIGIGSASIISRALGAKDQEKAERTLGNFFSLIVITGVLITLFGYLYTDPLLLMFGATETILPYASEYMTVIFLGSLFLCFGAGGNNIIRSEGAAKFAMMAMLSSAVLNIILDPIFIFALDMGIAGAAWATVAAQAASAIVALLYFVAGHSGIKVHLSNFVLRLKIIQEVFAIGSASLGRHVAGSFMAIILNHSLGFYGGDLAIAAFGVINRVMMIIFMPMFGLVQGLQPVLGYNYGAKAYDRAKEVVMLSMKVATIMAIVASVALIIFARPMAMAFSSDKELIDLASYATRIIAVGLPLIGFQVIAAGYYQALGKAFPAFFLSILRQVVILIPLVLVLPLFFELDGLWLSHPVSEVLASIITFLMIRRELKLLN